jgi:hypothetical protein
MSINVSRVRKSWEKLEFAKAERIPQQLLQQKTLPAAMCVV